MKAAINWEVVTSALLDGCEKPVAVLDGDLRFVLTSRELEALLGAERDDLRGRAWPEICVVPEEAERFADILDAGSEGRVHAFEETVVTMDKRVLRANFEARAIHPHSGPLLLLVVVRWTLIRASAPPGFDTDHHYEISASPLDFGTIRSFWSAGAPATDTCYVGRRCYEVLYGRSTRCGSCPAERAFVERKSLTIALRGRYDESRFRVMTAKPAVKDGVEVSVRELDASIVTPLIHARIDGLAQSSGLTSRERDVLELLLLGRSPDEIANVLGIASRTAKFHQKNLLAKLGADSRHDLLRLLV